MFLFFFTEFKPDEAKSMPNENLWIDHVYRQRYFILNAKCIFLYILVVVVGVEMCLVMIHINNKPEAANVPGAACPISRIKEFGGLIG